MSTPAPRSEPRHSHRILTRWTIGASAALIALQFFRWPIINFITAFLEPPLEIAAGIALLVLTVLALIHAVRCWKTLHTQSLLPAAICFITIAVVVWVPFNQLYFDANFHILRHWRTTVAESILSGPEGSTQNNGGRGNFITLPPQDFLLSADRVIAIDHRGGKAFVLFLTYRGILDRFSGFVYSPSDDPPAKDQFLGDGIEIERLAPHWFWYAS